MRNLEMNIFPISQPIRKRNPKGVNTRYMVSSQNAVFLQQTDNLRADIKTVLSIFDDKQVWADQCEYAISKVKMIQDFTEKLEESIKKKEQLSKLMKTIRYPILVDTNYIGMQANEIILLIQKFSKVRKSTSSIGTEQKEIQFILRQLDVNINDLNKKLRSITD